MKPKNNTKPPVRIFNPKNAKPLPIRSVLTPDEIKNNVFSITDKEWKSIRDSLVEKCKEGDTRAIQLLFSYCIGQPKQQLDVNLKTSISPEDSLKKVCDFFGIKKEETKNERDGRE